MKGLKKWLAGVDKLVAVLAAAALAAATGVAALTGVLGQVVDAVQCVEQAAASESSSVDKRCGS